MKLLILSVILVFLMIKQGKADCRPTSELLEQRGVSTATKFSVAIPRRLLPSVDLKINPQTVSFGLFLTLFY
jgi:hypothetical protein